MTKKIRVKGWLYPTSEKKSKFIGYLYRTRCFPIRHLKSIPVLITEIRRHKNGKGR